MGFEVVHWYFDQVFKNVCVCIFNYAHPFFVLGLQLHTDSPLLLNPLYFSCCFGCLQLFYLFCSSIFSFYWPVFQLSSMSFSAWNLLLKSSHKFLNSNIWVYNSGRNICFMFRDFNVLVISSYFNIFSPWNLLYLLE